VQRIAGVARRTTADGHPVACLAVGVAAAGQLGAGVAAVVVEARPVGGTVLRGGALALATVVQRVAEEAGGTGADGTLATAVVVARGAAGVASAGVGLAQVN